LQLQSAVKLIGIDCYKCFKALLDQFVTFGQFIKFFVLISQSNASKHL